MNNSDEILLERSIEVPIREGRDSLHTADLYYILYDTAYSLLGAPLHNIAISMLSPIAKKPLVTLYQGIPKQYAENVKAHYCFQANGKPYFFLLRDGSQLPSTTYTLDVQEIAKHCEYLGENLIKYNGPKTHQDLHILSTLTRLRFNKNYPHLNGEFNAIKIFTSVLLLFDQLSDYTVSLDYVNTMNIIKTTLRHKANVVGGQFIKFMEIKK